MGGLLFIVQLTFPKLVISGVMFIFPQFQFLGSFVCFQKFPCSQILAPDGIFTSQIPLPVKFMPSGSW